jgi:hypothetical protein
MPSHSIEVGRYRFDRFSRFQSSVCVLSINFARPPRDDRDRSSSQSRIEPTK